MAECSSQLFDCCSLNHRSLQVIDRCLTCRLFSQEVIEWGSAARHVFNLWSVCQHASDHTWWTGSDGLSSAFLSLVSVEVKQPVNNHWKLAWWDVDAAPHHMKGHRGIGVQAVPWSPWADHEHTGQSEAAPAGLQSEAALVGLCLRGLALPWESRESHVTATDAPPADLQSG